MPAYDWVMAQLMVSWFISDGEAIRDRTVQRRPVKLALTLTACLGLAALWAASWIAILSAVPLWAIILIVLAVVAVAASNP